MAEAILTDVVRLAASFQLSANREVLTAKDVLDALHVIAPSSQMLPGWTPLAAEGERIDLRSIRGGAESSTFTRPDLPLIESRLEGKRWLLSVCLPSFKSREITVDTSHPVADSLFYEFKQVPSTYSDAAKSTLEHIVNLWGSDQEKSHQELCAWTIPVMYAKALSPILGAIFSRVLSSGHPPSLFIRSGQSLLSQFIPIKEIPILNWCTGIVTLALTGQHPTNLSPLQLADKSLKVCGTLSNFIVGLLKRGKESIALQISDLVDQRINGEVRSDCFVLLGLLETFGRNGSRVFFSQPKFNPGSEEEFELAMVRQRIAQLVG